MTASPFIDAWLTGPGDSPTFHLAVLNLSNIEQDLSRNEETNAAYDADPLVGVPGSLRSLEDMITEGGRLLTNKYAHWPEDVSVLFLHGTADQVTSSVAAQQLYDKLPAKRKKMITYPGARHELHNEPDGVREQSLSAVADFIKTVTGGSQ
ncbi:hypothetical protein EYR38_002125 [Pleurotus pulmonarius]|nr:hypothetical protein EYR38_002125 [Pleurotus pulmonarius]